MLRLGCIERKEKGGKLRCRRTREGYYPFWVLCRDRVSLALCHDRVFRVATGFLGQVHDPAWARAIGMRGLATGMRECKTEDRDVHVATGFPGILDGLGHDRGFLYRDKDF